MADLTKLMKKLISNLRRSADVVPQAPLGVILRYDGPGTGKAVIGKRSVSIPYDFTDYPEMEAAKRMLQAGIPEARVSLYHGPTEKAGQAVERARTPKGTTVADFFRQELPDMSGLELNEMASGYQKVKNVLNIPDVNDIDMADSLINNYAGDADAMIKDMGPGTHGARGRKP